MNCIECGFYLTKAGFFGGKKDDLEVRDKKQQRHLSIGLERANAHVEQKTMLAEDSSL